MNKSPPPLTPADNSGRFERRIVLATLGLAPQVLTETLWCLCRQDPPFVPTEVHVVTTGEGRRRAQAALIDSGVMAALADDLGLAALSICLTPERLHVMHDHNGDVLADIDSEAGNEAAADTITGLIAGFTGDATTALHVSIAGGRKTMGFLAGYALSLYGRPQDRLSHVLVMEPFQSHPQFFFPTREPSILKDREGHPLSTADARLILADIPFVRLRPALDPAVFHPQARYSQLVTATQRRFRPTSLLLDLTAGRCVAHGTAITLPPLTLAFAAMLAEAGSHGAALSFRDMDWRRFSQVWQAIGNPDRRLAAPRLSDPRDQEDLFRQQASKFRAALRRALGPDSHIYAPVVEGMRPTTRIRLPLSASEVTLHGMPPADKPK